MFKERIEDVSKPEMHTQIVNTYTPEIAAGIGRLMAQLDPTFSADPVPEDVLQPIIISPDHDQFVSLTGDGGDQVVAAASMTVVRGAGFNKRGQLEDFVVDEAFRGQGVGRSMWKALIDWCRAHDLNEFYLQTETFRPDAIAFYNRVGAKVMNGTVTYKVGA